MKRREIIKLFGALPMAQIPFQSFSQSKSFGSPISVAADGTYDLVIYEATPGGVALAVRAAREGLRVFLANHNHHPGGQFVNGLGTMDTLYNGARAPLYDELRYNIYDFYRARYGYQSPQYEATNPGYAKTRFESHVMEILISGMLENEPYITLLKGYCPLHADRTARAINSVTFKQTYGNDTVTVRGSIFADCSYEGDLAAISGVPCRLGRESQKEFGEKNAGFSYYKKNFWPPSDEVLNNADFKLARQLNLVRYDTWSYRMPESTGEAHEAIMAYNIRTTLTNDPENRIIPGKPEHYEPDFIKKRYGEVNGAGLGVPNQKTSWNEPRMAGLPNQYIEGDWEKRKEIMDRFREVTLGLLYFKQSDPSVPAEERKRWQQYGLPKNEYTDNGYLPYEIYVREGRRIIGRSIFTEHSASLAEGLRRAPVQPDSISITEWFMDSHFCTESQVEGSKMEGEVMLKNKTFPGQLPLGTIFPESIDNLMVPVCLSTTHIGWGTIRLEPTWMSICEAAAYVAVTVIRDNKTPPEIDSDQLIRHLANRKIMISFFNDVEGRESAPWYSAVQYLGTKGFFGSYNARPNEKLTTSLADAWLAGVDQLHKFTAENLSARAAKIWEADQREGDAINAGDFAQQLASVGKIRNVLQTMTNLGIVDSLPISRGDACRLIFEVTGQS